MTFRERVAVWFIILVLIIVLVFSIFFYLSSSRQLIGKAYNNLQFLADTSSNQLDEMLKPMEFVISSLLSNQDIVAATTTMAKLERTSEAKNATILLAKGDINRAIYSDYLLRNFRRVSYFNNSGDFLTNDFISTTMTDGNVDIAALPWLLELGESLSNTRALYLVPPHTDDWNTKDGQEVFSVVKGVQGDDRRGYIEVQKSTKELKTIFTWDESLFTDAVVINASGELVYSSVEDERLPYYSAIALKKESLNRPVRNPISQQQELVSTVYSDYAKVYVCLIQNQQGWQDSLLSLDTQVVFMFAIVLVASVLYTIILANTLTKPIRELKNQIEATTIEDIDRTANFRSSNNEVQNLKDAYTGLMDRLKTAVVNESERAALQTQAQLDALQAQINPHFIFNVLNVISYYGVKNNDDAIVDICENLASMLRYSTNTSRKDATIREELGYAKNYIILLAHRYQDKLRYSETVSKELMDIKIPKVTLQQFVENSVNHGYNNIERDILIEITGGIVGDRWNLKITDNGEGISPETLAGIRLKLAEILREYKENNINHEMEIGGMGIYNTYARLLIYTGGKVGITIDSQQDKGTTVTVQGKLK